MTRTDQQAIATGLIIALISGTALPLAARADEKGKDDKARQIEARRAAAMAKGAGQQQINTAAPTPGVPGTPGAQTPTGPAPTVIGAQPVELPPPAPGTYRIGPYSEPVDVKLLVDLVAQELQIQVIASDVALADKKIWLLTHVDVPRERLLEFLGYLLERNGQYITREADFVWVIKPVTDLQGAPGSDKQSTTQVLATKGIRPTQLTLAVNNLLQGGGNPQPGVQQAIRVTYLDDLGVMIVNDTPRRIALVQALIDRVAEEQLLLQFTRFEVKHISANTAKARILELLGRTQRNVVQAFNPNDPNAAAQAQVQSAGGSSSNLAERLVPEGNSNSLILRGRPEEKDLVERLLQVVDVVNQLVPRWYPVGPAASPLAEQAKRQGLGDVTVLQSQRGNQNGFQQGFDPNQQQFAQQRFGAGSSSGDQTGPVFVLDPEQRGFMYYGTEEQHARVKTLVEEFKEPIQAERVIYEFYKLRFADAEKTAETIRGMITNTVPAGDSPLIPGQGGSVSSGRGNAAAALASAGVNVADGSIGEIVASEQVFVLADKSNNQVVVKAPTRLQAQFQRLVERLDQRRAQVYIDAKVVVVTDNDDFRLAIETQLINAGGTGGAVRTSLQNGSTTAGTVGAGGILNRPTVNPLSGITAAIIKSDQIPVIINALQTVTDSRIVASPQILVDDNEEAEISSIEQRATTTTTQNPTGGPTTSFGGYQDAGPRLKVKPRISTSDLLSLKYEIELSSFAASTGNTATGIPPDKQENKVRSDSATIPSDSTIVVGGLNFEEDSNTVAKVPLLGDIPLIGEAFKSTSKNKRKRLIYVFLTPRIMRDPAGNDLRLFTRGPASTAKINLDLPAVKPEMMEIIERLPAKGVPAAPAPAPAPAPSPAPEATPAPATPATPPEPSAPTAPTPVTTP